MWVLAHLAGLPVHRGPGADAMLLVCRLASLPGRLVQGALHAALPGCCSVAAAQAWVRGLVRPWASAAQAWAGAACPGDTRVTR